jgi:hypothetical protein
LVIAPCLAATNAAVAGTGYLDFQLVHIRGPAAPGVVSLAINNREDLAAYVNMQSAMHPSPQVGVAPEPPSPRVEPPEIDFRKYTLLVFSKGPSTGHSILFGDIR